MQTSVKASGIEKLTTAWADEPLGLGENWKPLRYFNLYRAVLSGLLVLLAYLGLAPSYFGQYDPGLFRITALVYLLFSLVSSFSIQWRWTGFQTQVVTQVIVDIAALTLMMHASGGVASGFGTLMVVAIAGGSILTQGRIAILFAAMASLAVLFQQIYAWMYAPFPGSNYTQAGMLGMTFFATAFLAHVLARRVRATEALAEKRGIDLANLAQLSEHIIQRMQSGVLVLDREGTVRLINRSGQKLLGLPGDITGQHLDSLAPELTRLETSWRNDTVPVSNLLRSAQSQVEMMVSFSRLGVSGEDGALVYLEDASAMRQRAQQLKLASLGRLTASIAHEIRNPLGAISHAAQLLAESSDVQRHEQRFIHIIQQNCRRMNAIVENVLQLSRRKTAVRETLLLNPWLQGFVSDFVNQTGLDGAVFKTSVELAVRVRFDPSQLHQVMWNLCENAIRHAGERPRLHIRAGVSPESRRPYLEVADNGKGIADDIADKLFEPFFTTESSGTGLGLYIARELCEINQASLGLVETEGSGACFRITFIDPRRREVPVA